MLQTYTDRYSKNSLLDIFLFCAFPVHLWSIFLILFDADWVTERTSQTGFLGYGAYTLTLTLIETGLIFVGLILVSLVIPPRWDKQAFTAVLKFVFSVIVVWFFIGQADAYYTSLEAPLILQIQDLFANNPTLWRILIFGLIVFTASLPVWLGRREKTAAWFAGLSEKLMPLTLLYLGLDALSLVIILVRNL